MQSNILSANEQKKKALADKKEMFEQRKREEESIELKETEVSKKLAASMLKSSRNKCDDTLQKAVEVLQNQNSKLKILDVCTTILNLYETFFQYLNISFIRETRIYKKMCILLPLFPTAHTITMKRSSKILVNASKLQTERDKLFAENQTKMIAILEDLQSKVQKLAYQFDMKKNVNILDFFPIKTDADMARFLDNSDGNFKHKKEEFEQMFYCHVTNTIKFKRPFETNLLAVVFSRDYITSHKWPGPR